MRHMGQTFIRLPQYSDIPVTQVRTIQHGLSQHYRYALTTSTLLNPHDLLGENVEFILHGVCMHGVLTEISCSEYEGELMFESPLVRLSHHTRNQVYTSVKLSEILKNILLSHDWLSSQLIFSCRDEHLIDYCNQYNESDFNFFMRQLAFYGWMFAFVERDGQMAMLITDDYQVLINQFSPLDLPVLSNANMVSENDALYQFTQTQSLCANVVEVNDYNPSEPLHNLRCRSHNQSGIPGYGCDSTQRAHVQTETLGNLISQNKQHVLNSQRRCYQAYSTHQQHYVGQRINVCDAVHSSRNQDYYVTAISYTPKQRHCHLTLQAATYTFCVDCTLYPKPRLGYIYGKTQALNDAGSYTVLLEHSPFSTKPISVNQLQAGRDFGTNFPFATGEDVIIGHVNEDPDKPYIVGCLAKRIPADTISLHSKDNQKINLHPDGFELATDNNHVKASSDRGIELATKGELDIRVAGDYQQHCESHQLAVKQSYRLDVDQDFNLRSDGDIHQSAQQDIKFCCMEGIMISSHDVKLSASRYTQQSQRMTVKSASAHLQAQQIELLSADDLNLTATQEICIQVGASQLSISSAQIRFQGNVINLRGY